MFLLLRLVLFILLFQGFNNEKENPSINDNKNLQINNQIEWKCDHLDTAYVKIVLHDNNNSNSNNHTLLNKFNKFSLFYQNKLCNNCNLIHLKSFNNNKNKNGSIHNQNYFILDSYYSYNFMLVETTHNNDNNELLNDSGNQIICQNFDYENFGECGIYSFDVFDKNNCSINVIKSSRDSNYYFKIVLCTFVVLFILSHLTGKHFQIFEFLKNYFIDDHHGSHSGQQKDGINISFHNKNRINSLDAFRGFSLFLMIFVNYGGGGYKFMQHAPWHGITIADFVFPWFLWIMGFTIPIIIHSTINKGNLSRFVIFKRIFFRALKLFMLGIMINSRYGVSLSQLRILGVLQRISICFFVVSCLELFLYKNIQNKYETNNWKYFVYDLIWSTNHFIIMSFILLMWLLLTFFLPVPGCPTGYFGPGGLENNSSYFNCTGGSAMFIDRLILGKDHMYSRPTTAKIYKTLEPFEPEGLLGSLTSIVLTYFGVQAGRLTIFYKSKSHRLISWIIYGFVCLLSFSFLTNFNLTESFIPVNKNLWTLSYILLTGSSSFFIIAFLYYIIDMKNYSTGTPFIYLGMNSIIIYICHVFFSTTIPCQWLVSNTHLSQLLMDLWGSCFWTLISIYLYAKNIFINL